jgi:hypothetical protein
VNCACRIQNNRITFCPEHFARLLRMSVADAFAAIQRAISGDMAGMAS